MDTAKKEANKAVKLDNGKPKLSLIHPEMLALFLNDRKKKGVGKLIDAMLNVSRAAHADNNELFVAYIEASISNLIDFACGESRALVELTRAMEYGASKPEYGRNNWKKGMEWSRLADAALRHGLAILDGEDVDADSGNTHLAHMLGSIHMLFGNYHEEIGTNDLY